MNFPILLTILIVACLLQSSELAAQAYAPKSISGEHAIQDVRLFRETLDRVHPGYDRYTGREALDQLVVSIERDAADGMTDVELYRRFSYVLAKIRCSHTKAEVPESFKKHREAQSSFLPFSVRAFSGRIYVDRVHTSASGLRKGDELLGINDRPIGQVLQEVEALLSVDGWTDHAKYVQVEGSSEMMGNAIDHFWPFLYEWPERWRLQIRRGGDELNVEADPVTYGEWLTLATGGSTEYQDFGPKTVAFERLGNDTAYLAIETFVNYRNSVDPVALLNPYFEEMRKANVGHLVLDLRKCGGGSDDVPMVLVQFLATGPIKITRTPSRVRTYRFDGLRQYLSTWDESVWNLPDDMFAKVDDKFYEFRPPDFQASTTIQPFENHFMGRLSVLSNAANCSGATNVIALLRNRRENTRVVGEPTGGTVEGTTAGVIFFLKLPHSGITVRVPALRNFNGIKDFSPGLGVQPDLAVLPTFRDFMDQRDPVLATALNNEWK